MSLKIELRPGLEFETGCIFDGAHGRYNPPRLIDMAANVSSGQNWGGQPDGGFVLDNDDRRALAMYNDDESGTVKDGTTAGEWVDDLANEAETYLNSLIPGELPNLPENVSGIGFTWESGDFVLAAFNDNGEMVDV